MREKLRAWGGPYIIENVVGAPLEDPVILCGSMFGLDVRRHRLFESSLFLDEPECRHEIWKPNRFPGGRSRERGGPRVLVRATVEVGRWNIPLSVQQAAMGIGWITDVRMLSESIPPAYSEFLGRQVAAFIKARRTSRKEKTDVRGVDPAETSPERKSGPKRRAPWSAAKYNYRAPERQRRLPNT